MYTPRKINDDVMIYVQGIKGVFKIYGKILSFK